MKKRALWLIGKELVNDSDIPWLMEAGYEIYTVKNVPWKMRAERLCSTDRFDHTLTIDNDMKRELDVLSFFEPVSDEMWEEINREFNILFIDYYKDQFETVLEKFTGTIVLRTLGRPDSVSRSKVLVCTCLSMGFEKRVFHPKKTICETALDGALSSGREGLCRREESIDPLPADKNG